MLGLRCFAGFSLVVTNKGSSLVTTCELLSVVASLAVEQGSRVERFSSRDTGLQSTGSVAVVPGLAVPRHVESSQIKDWENPCLLHWQVDALPLSHQGRPKPILKWIKVSKRFCEEDIQMVNKHIERCSAIATKENDNQNCNEIAPGIHPIGWLS